MNTNVEELLRQGMERCTADLRAPGGLARLAARRRRRRLVRRSVGAAVTVLAAGAVAVAAVVVPGEGSIGRQVTQAAYVLKRVDSALSAAEPGAIAQMTLTTRAALPDGKTVTKTAEEWSHDGRWRSVAYSPDGRPAYDEGSTASHAYTLVSYLKRTWSRRQLQAGLLGPAPGAPARLIGPGISRSNRPIGPKAGSHGCLGPAALVFQTGLPGIGTMASSLPATVARDLRTAISCGALTVAGRQRVDGIKAIKLTSTAKSLISETIWASPATYLPVRVVVAIPAGHPVIEQTADITWLPPTQQNLAKLTVPIPAGFRRVPLRDVVQPIIQQIPGLPLTRASGVGVPGPGSSNLGSSSPGS